jgi:hypothetical protein
MHVALTGRALLVVPVGALDIQGFGLCSKVVGWLVGWGRFFFFFLKKKKIKKKKKKKI